MGIVGFQLEGGKCVKIKGVNVQQGGELLPCRLQSPSSVLASDVVRVFHGLAVVSLLLQKQSPEICEILDIGTIKI